MSQKKWILLFIIVIAAMAGIWFFLKSSGKESHTVVITSEGRTLYTIDLDRAEDDTIVIESSRGSNTVVIKDGGIYVEEADCPDGICVKHGPLEKNGTPIVCLPHQLVIRFAEDASEVDN